MLLANGCNITVKNVRGCETFPYSLYTQSCYNDLLSTISYFLLVFVVFNVFIMNSCCLNNLFDDPDLLLILLL